MKTKSSSVKPTCFYVVQSRVGEQPEILCGNPVKYTLQENDDGSKTRKYNTFCDECAKKVAAQEAEEELQAAVEQHEAESVVAAETEVPVAEADLGGFGDVVKDVLMDMAENIPSSPEVVEEVVVADADVPVVENAEAAVQPDPSSEAKYDRWVKAVRLWAERHPKQNGGYITNCWTDAEIRAHLVSNGTKTQKEATDEFYHICQVNKEMAEEIKNA